MILADHGMHTEGWVFLLTWGIGGLIAGIGVGLFVELESRKPRADRHSLGSEPPAVLAGFVFLFLPVVAAIGAVHVLGWIFSGGISRLADRVEGRRRSREKLEARIDELERELAL